MTAHPQSHRSLWLVPVGTDAEVLQRLVDELATICGGPPFRPHLTLCSRIPEGSLPELRPSALPLTAGLGPLAFGGEYFHACYLPLEPDGEVRALQGRSAEASGGQPPAHLPHLSLFYGSLNAEQQAVARGVAERRPIRVTLARCELWHTGGPVTDWRRLATSF